ncbi:hypothetical protein HC891_12745 [Candidatus Gracilibacteria bacterium]|nr:hypothetical protein [Candidatus Gracilibacteria bacterium]
MPLAGRLQRLTVTVIALVAVLCTALFTLPQADGALQQADLPTALTALVESEPNNRLQPRIRPITSAPPTPAGSTGHRGSAVGSTRIAISTITAFCTASFVGAGDAQ